MAGVAREALEVAAACPRGDEPQGPEQPLSTGREGRERNPTNKLL